MKKKLLIGMDASRSTREKPTGVEQYSTAILQALLPELKDVELRLYTPQKIAAFPQKLQRVIPGRRLWTLLHLSWEMLWHKPDVLFVPAHVLPFFAPRRSFMTVHDIAFEKIPEAYSWRQGRYLRWSTRRALRKAERVLVPTEAVKQDLMEIYGAPEEKLLVLHHGVSPLPKVTDAQVKRFYKKWGLAEKEPVFFFLGRLEAKKNIATLVEAWSIVQKMYSTGQLVLAGSDGQGMEAIRERIAQEGLPRVFLPGYISDEEAACLFTSATCFIYPSREEGFGLPILQAYAAGCNVIASDIPVLREVAGEGALFADPGHAKDFAEQMLRILEDKKLRADLKAKATVQVKQFSWKKSAQALAGIFKTQPHE